MGAPTSSSVSVACTEPVMEESLLKLLNMLGRWLNLRPLGGAPPPPIISTMLRSMAWP